MRNSTLENAARQWLNTDPEAAQAWIRASYLSQDLKSSLLVADTVRPPARLR